MYDGVTRPEVKDARNVLRNQLRREANPRTRTLIGRISRFEKKTWRAAFASPFTSIEERTMTAAADTAKPRTVDMKLEAIVIPVSDVDRAKRFYGGLGWRLDADFPFDNGFRVVQFTPPGSGCSIQFGTNITSAAPGSAQGLYLIVAEIEAARADLVARGVEVSEVFHAETPGAQFQPDGTSGRVSGPAPDHASYRSFVTFSDPDGNGWLFQEVTARLPGRVDATDTTFTSSTELAAALRRAATAHGEHEKRTGQHDTNWPDWYAEYIVKEQAGKELPA
jgi:catechol 2,3-dioxygenase-like lactoylglutathione lyase family enzyme